MEKKDIIKSLIRFFTIASSPCLVFDTHNNEGMQKLSLKVLMKEVQAPLNISFISPSDEFFNEIFPNLKDNVKTGVKYTLGTHKISFYKLEKTILKKPPEGSEVLFFYPCDDMKEKDIIKMTDNCKTLKKVIFIGKSIPAPYKGLRKYNPIFISLKPSDETAYYESMKQKLFDIK
ncbi:hypothetical protein ACQPU1_00575 [Clostridium paraputrificum]|uniref:hypothetical protein n=1 Tax=Clostridium TaxID=1485 RepID=UPI003D338DF9